MPPRITAKAPKTPTAAYTRLFTKRVAGLVMEEKKIACREQPWSLSLISPNWLFTASSREKVFTIFWFPIISSTREVCSPRVWDWSLNME